MLRELGSKSQLLRKRKSRMRLQSLLGRANQNKWKKPRLTLEMVVAMAGVTAVVMSDIAVRDLSIALKTDIHRTFPGCK